MIIIRKYLSMIVIPLVLVGFYLFMPQAEAQVLLYVSPAPLLGINFDYSEDVDLKPIPPYPHS